jgi:hypothetical protein
VISGIYCKYEILLNGYKGEAYRMYTYKVVNVVSQWKGIKLIAPDFEKFINFESAQGWKLFQIVPHLENGYSVGHNLVFEREVQ